MVSDGPVGEPLGDTSWPTEIGFGILSSVKTQKTRTDTIANPFLDDGRVAADQGKRRET